MEIRPLISDDRKKISGLLRQAGVFNDKEIQVALEVIDEALEKPEKQDYHIFCCLDGDGTLAGYICFGPIPMTEGCYDLYWIVVGREYSRMGLGRRLLEYMELCTAGHRIRRIYVETSSSPPYEAARSFYEKNGYRLACILEDFYREGDHKMTFMKEIGHGAP